MIDYFALLGEPRRPWLDLELFEQKFRELSAEAHPDRAHAAGERGRMEAHKCFTDLNQAFQCLRNPRTRLRHLLELSCGTKPQDLQQITPELMELFNDVGQVCRASSVLLNELESSSSALVRVTLFRRGQGLLEAAVQFQGKLSARRDELLDEVRALDRAWEDSSLGQGTEQLPALPWARIEQIHRQLGFLDRWMDQLREVVARLHF